MGAKDSSKTRVEPIFDLLFAKYTHGADWLPQLLRLPIGGTNISIDPRWDLTIEDKGWGDEDHLANGLRGVWNRLEFASRPGCRMNTKDYVLCLGTFLLPFCYHDVRKNERNIKRRIKDVRFLEDHREVFLPMIMEGY